jgi:hypothetical protein
MGRHAAFPVHERLPRFAVVRSFHSHRTLVGSMRKAGLS